MEQWARGKKHERAPGPGAYSVPSSFGEGPKYSLRSRPKERVEDKSPPLLFLKSSLDKKKISFGYRPPDKPVYVTPAPYKYEIPSSAPKFTIGNKIPDKLIDGVSPDAYTIDRSILTTPKRIHSGRRTDFVDRREIAPPGAYEMPSQFSKHKPITIGESIPLQEPERCGPGPGYYSEGSTPRGRASKIGNIHTTRDLNEDNPAPTNYTISREITNKDAVSINMKGRPNLPHGDICDYPYYKLPDTIIPKHISIGHRPETSYETISPGPIYGSKSSIEKRPISIGNKIQSKDPFALNPSPDSYYVGKSLLDETNGVTIPMTAHNYIIDEKKAAEVPGPGTYDDYRHDTANRGFSFTTRKMEDFKSDTAAPYYALKSTLGGYKFTIKHREDTY